MVVDKTAQGIQKRRVGHSVAGKDLDLVTAVHDILEEEDSKEVGENTAHEVHDKLVVDKEKAALGIEVRNVALGKKVEVGKLEAAQDR